MYVSKYIYIHIYIYICTHIYVFLCVYECVYLVVVGISFNYLIEICLPFYIQHFYYFIYDFMCNPAYRAAIQNKSVSHLILSNLMLDPTTKSSDCNDVDDNDGR